MSPADESRPARSPIPATPAPSSGFPTAPIIGLDTPLDGQAPPQASTEQARAHEAAAEVLADRGDWRRAYHHLKAAVVLTRDERALPVDVPDQLRHEVVRLRRERAEAREQSRRDSLTATYNRRYLDERLSTLRGSTAAPLCVALADVDHFKQVNDAHGHLLGDEVLRVLVCLMNEGLPVDGFCARYGGEEFALVLPGLDAAEAVRVCEAVRARVDSHPWWRIAAGLRVTTSIGVTCLAAGADPSGTGLDAADGLLYVAKRAGRNAVAFRDADDGAVRLAGAAAGRRGLEAIAHAAFRGA